MKFDDIQQREYNFLGLSGKVSGHFHFTGITHIHGHLEGKVQIDGPGPLVIGPGGFIVGDITCHDVEIFGQFKGQIQATGKLIIHPSAVFEGEVISQDLKIFAGSSVTMSAQTRQQDHTPKV